MRGRQRRPLSPVDLRQIYAEPGTYSVKFLVDSDMSPGLTSCKVNMYDVQGRQMQIETRRWGTKVNVTFTIDDSVPDGAAIIEVSMSGSSERLDERFRVWVCK